jgi:hypothetical protein
MKEPAWQSEDDQRRRMTTHSRAQPASATMKRITRHSYFDAPSGTLPKEEWLRKTREQNEAVQQAIKSDTIDSLTQN